MIEKPIEMAFLGGVSFLSGGAPLEGLASRRTEALLVYLACTGRPHAREALAGFLWDDLPQNRALGNLRVLLTGLRHALGEGIIITRQRVALNPDMAAWVDVTQFEDGLAAARRQRSSNGGLRALAHAVSLYRGEFLQGFFLRGSRAFSDWQDMERERLRLRAVHALDELAEVCMARGDFASGIDHARRLLALDPLRERTHSLLMMLFAQSGQREAALTQYETCRRMLDDEMEIAPLEETARLAEQIRAGAFAPSAALVNI